MINVSSFGPMHARYTGMFSQIAVRDERDPFFFYETKKLIGSYREQFAAAIFAHFGQRAGVLVDQRIHFRGIPADMGD